MIGEEDGYILLLNVSSMMGKEHKLIHDSNEEIIHYNPPFRVSSFVKLDALYKVEKCEELQECILARNERLDSEELSRLLDLRASYIQINEVLESIVTARELREYLTR